MSSTSVFDASSGKKSLRIGVLLCAPVQFLDVAPIDLFAMLTPEFLKIGQFPEAIVATGQKLEIIYITALQDSIGDTPALVPLTASAELRATYTLNDAGPVDILLVPGPNPSYEITPHVASFLQHHVASGGTLLSICTGILPVVMSGVLDGKRATAPLQILPVLKKKFPKVEWTAHRWEITDGAKIWTSGIVTNGLDMITAFLEASFPSRLVDLVFTFAGVQGRAQNYSEETKEAMRKLFSQMKMLTDKEIDTLFD